MHYSGELIYADDEDEHFYITNIYIVLQNLNTAMRICKKNRKKKLVFKKLRHIKSLFIVLYGFYIM